jgi:hypothetical protein
MINGPENQQEEENKPVAIQQEQQDEAAMATEVPQTEQKSKDESNVAAETIALIVEQQGQEEAEEEHHEDIDSLDKSETIARLKEILRNQDVSKARLMGKLKAHFDQIIHAEEHEARQKFIQQGNPASDFEYRHGQDVANLNNLVTVYFKSVRQSYEKDQESRKANLIMKNALLENLRELCEEAESKDSFNKLKQLQSDWKSVGQVPQKEIAEINRNYSALLEIFYNNRKLYIELIELDRKRNLEQKEHLILKVEKLIEAPFNIKQLTELNHLHEEFKQVGPVPKEKKEELWEKFKAASDKLYERKKEHLQQLNEEWEKNFQSKMLLLDSLKLMAQQVPESPKQWFELSDNIQKIIEQWKAIGKVPQEKVAEVNKPFWSEYKLFLQKKTGFFKQLDKQKAENYKQLVALCEKAESLFDENWQQHIEEIKEIQQQWKAVGPVAKEKKDKIFDRFKKACDQFFQKRREEGKKREEEELQNLQAKEQICEQLEKTDPNTNDLSTILNEIKSSWQNIGFVPIKDKERINKRYKKAIDQLIGSSNSMPSDERDLKKLEMELASTSNQAASAKIIAGREQALRKRINQLELECQNIENNMLMFSRSSKGSGLLAQYEQQVVSYKKQIEQAKEQLKKMRSMGS